LNLNNFQFSWRALLARKNIPYFTFGGKFRQLIQSEFFTRSGRWQANKIG